MPFGSNKKLVALLGILFSAIILVTAAVAVLQSDSPLFADQSGSSAPQVSQPQVSNVGSVPSESASGLTPVVPNFPNDLPETGDSTVTFNRPGEMRAVTLTPGIDYLASSDKSQHTVQGEIDAAMQKASELTMNTVFLTAVTDQGAAYPSGWLPQLAVAFDPLAYAIDKAREKGLYVYCIYPLLAVPAGEKVSAADFVDATMLDNVKKELSAFAKSYKADGILFDQFYSPTTEKSYGRYLQSGGGIGYKEYLRTAARTLLTQAARAVRSNARGTQVGLLADADADTATDLKSWVADKLVDFLAVRAFGSLTDSNVPFGATARRWCDLGTSGTLPLYLVHAADRICTDAPGWRSPDQMTKQIIEARKTAGYNGSVFQSLAALSADTQGATTLLLRFFRDEVSSDYILAELAMSRPTEFTYETYETVAIFQGATYPGIPVTLNGEGLPTNQSGYFSVTQPLKPGLNTIVLQSKDKTFTYHITRKVKVLQSISPRGRMTVEGGMELTVTVEAYQGSKVTATLAGETILLEELLDEDDDTDKDSSYLRYVGYFTAPEATTSIQKLGAISVRAVYEGIAEQGSGANITVNKQPEIGSGTPVRVTVAQAETFPAGSLNDYASPDCYPLPKGALDFAVGDEIIFSQGNSTYRYYMLESGRRVYSSSVATSNAVPRGNVIQGMSITNDGRYTSVVLSMLQTVSYTASYSNSGMSFQFHYTDKVPGNLPELTKNPLFSAAVWKDSTLTLPFRIGGGMLGYRASYDEAGKTLILRFNNVPATLGEARIVLDPGHGGSDPGALGNISGKHESYLNAQIALKLEAALKNAGASVYRISTDSKVELPDRVAKAYAYDPQLFISIHCNSALNTAAQGHEVYFFYPFSRGLAASVNRGIGSGIPVDRGAKYGLFYVTRTPHYGAVLSESGFVSNYDEYSQLLNSSVQQRIASGIVSSLGDYLAELSAGSYPQGTEKIGTVVTPPPATTTQPDSSAGSSGSGSSGSSGSGAVTAIRMDENNYSVTLKPGGKQKLEFSVVPNVAVVPPVQWSSADPNIATVAADGTVTAVTLGSTKIKVALSSDVELYDICDLRVSDGSINSGKITGVALDRTELTLNLKKYTILKATIQPATGGNRALKWTSSNPSIVRVGSTGRVTGIQVGSATVTVTTVDGGHTATCKITVVDPTVKPPPEPVKPPPEPVKPPPEPVKPPPEPVKPPPEPVKPPPEPVKPPPEPVKPPPEPPPPKPPTPPEPTVKPSGDPVGTPQEPPKP